ncbi:hypothetical protein RRG08_042296 [Elysia crispata]|uniref:heparosan-N-sulfate-glucuronate 5-epimerase n=1 Tax=Elysia crispata TaxID=231223 RepID=A0AAE1E061_9GAST|nr:hypothetical protein RRG08_042296 [Elysia crispata]
MSVKTKCGKCNGYTTQCAAIFAVIVLTVLSTNQIVSHHSAVRRHTRETGQKLQVNWSDCAPCPPESRPQSSLVQSAWTELSRINCSVDGDYMIGCRQDTFDVFLPASFINKYFEVYGELSPPDDHHQSQWYNFRSSYGTVHPLQQADYTPTGGFLNFHKYNVEARRAILCVTAAEGVPLATQWDKAGYFYAISIAQFGLSHHAKAQLEPTPVTRNFGAGDADLARWRMTAPGSSIKRVLDRVGGVDIPVLAFTSPASFRHGAPTLSLNTQERALSFQIKLTGPGGITVKIKTRRNTFGYVSYALVDKILEVKGDHVTYGMKIGNTRKWLWLTRDLFIDWLKGLGNPKISTNWFLEIVEVTLHGRGYLANMTVAASAHTQNLIQAADWLVNHQDRAGGWPTSVPIKTRAIELPPNWYSAMAQGQAMSVLVRAYNLTQEAKYLEAAVGALALFTRESTDGGVRTRFLGQLDWYEEYPTSPATFVLNGFIFSLLGLYDVQKTAGGDGQRLAQQLWTSGLFSLKKLLGLFDTGEGTLYDLRHVISHEPPNRARWDYHMTHIALLQQVALVDVDPVFSRTARRWLGYCRGERTPHN